ncbi:MAG: hypothetical protein ACREFW_08900 [Rhizomicrobium sp.]
MTGKSEMALAEEHMQQAKERLARQRALVEDLRRKGHDLSLASGLLDRFGQSFNEEREHLETLRRKLGRTKRRAAANA